MSKWFFFVEYLSENMEFLPQNGALAIHSDAPHTNLPHSVVAWVGPPHVVDTPIKKDHKIKMQILSTNQIFNLRFLYNP